MRQIDICLQIDHLRQLSRDFAAQHQAVRTLQADSGSSLLQKVAPAIPAVHDLVARSLVRLAVLDGSQYTATPGSRSTLDALGSVVAISSNAATTLCAAVAANPPAAPPTEGTVHVQGTALQLRPDEAAPMVAQSLADAALQLDACATACEQTANGIAHGLAQHPEHRPPLPTLTAAQYATLDKVAQGGARRFASIRGNNVTMIAKDDSTLHAKPVSALERHRMIRIQKTSAASGQSITITAVGMLALEVQQPSTKRTSLPAAVPHRTDKSVKRR